MTRKEALTELLEKVEAGEWDLPEHDAMSALDQQEVEDAFGHALHGQMYRGYHAYTGSLDAALALFEAVLPGWRLFSLREFGNEWRCSVEIGIRVNPKSHKLVGGEHASNPARSWLIAILKALVSEAD